jgi:cation diffusion facilitator CzcD-associated flavoprotein CzcO
MTGNIEQVETVIIGGGHAGLTMSYFLSQLGREHVILERGRVGERWRSEPGTPFASNFLTGLSSYRATNTSATTRTPSRRVVKSCDSSMTTLP